MDRAELTKQYIELHNDGNKTHVAEKLVHDYPLEFPTVEYARNFVRRYWHKPISEVIPEGFKVDTKGDEQEITFDTQTEIRTLPELIERCHIDTATWNIIRYVQNYWGNRNNPNWQVKVWLSKKTEEQLFQDAFIAFLSTYQPSCGSIDYLGDKTLPKACLIINKQDAHLNKLDVNGDNDIEQRFENIEDKIKIITAQAALSNDIESLTYILGSDEFNSEFTGLTTKGTPQQNIESYQSAFEKICDHNIRVVETLLRYANNVDVVLVSGNHDEHVSYHLVNLLKTYFRTENRISFDTSPKYRKYLSYGASALMFNHGDAIKPNKLAALFPMEYKDNWSAHEYFYIFTGDKHHEMSHDFNGIKFYQLPALSSAKSLWDEKNGYTCAKAEVNGFLIDEVFGMTNIYKQYLN